MLHNAKGHLFVHKRSSSRIFMPSVDVEIVSMNGSPEKYSVLRVTDISATGMNLRMAHAYTLKKGQTLKLRFLGPSTLEGFAVEAMARHCRLNISRRNFGRVKGYSTDIGCEFIFSDAANQAVITEWITRELGKKLGGKNTFWARLVCFFLMRRLSGWKFHPVRTFVELKRCFYLAYREYLKRGFIPENGHQILFHFHSLLPHAVTLTASRKSGEIGGTISIIPDHPEYGLPLEKIFSEEVQKLRGQGRRIGEVGLLATDKSLFPRKSFSLGNLVKMKFLFLLYRIMFIQARLVMGLDDLVIIVNPRHVPIYRYIQFYQYGPVKTYEGVNHAPAVFMRMDIDKAGEVTRREQSPDRLGYPPTTQN